MSLAHLACVFVGAGTGACLRWQLTVHSARLLPQIPYLGTLASNFISCFLVGAAAALFGLKAGLAHEWRLLFMTGFCGGLSTLAALSVETMELFSAADGWRGVLPALGYLALNAGGSVVLCLLGMLVAERVWGG